jgi:hypothetical protein
MKNYLFSLDTKLQYLIIVKNCLIIWLSNLFNLSVIQKRVMRTKIDIDVFINTKKRVYFEIQDFISYRLQLEKSWVYLQIPGHKRMRKII